MTPDERQAATLAALDRLIELEQAATAGPWRTHDTDLGSLGGHIAVLRNDAARSLRGRRSILMRHAPHDGRCTSCLEWCECIEGARVEDCAHGNTPWPCPDWRDAAAGLEVPDGV